MASINKFHALSENIAEKVHNFAADTLKVMLTNVAPVATNTIRVNLTELGAGNGYVAGGLTASISSSAQISGTYKLVLGDVIFTATGGTIGPFRYAVLYNDTVTSPTDPLIAWWDYGESFTLQNGETFTVDFDASTGVLTIA